MTLARRDAMATGLNGPAGLTYIATHEAWDVPLVGVLGGAAFLLGVLALVIGSLTLLSLLVADMVVLWVLTTFRHAHAPPGRPTTT